MTRLYELVTRAARASVPVLIVGETGSGKELIAHALHERSSGRQRPFQALNCAAIPPSLVEGMLFGHERGSFTGAHHRARGVFEQAQGGTVFLDEVAELSPQAQAALLRVLEARRFVRVGGTTEIEVDVRVIAATHRDLEGMVAAGSFREDLLYRLDVLRLSVPPLRERRDEILALANLFLARARQMWSATATHFAQDVERALLAYDWPGNVRQLKNVIERAAVVCQHSEIQRADLPSTVTGADATAAIGEWPDDTANELSLPERVRAFEAGCIRAALDKARGNQAEAARMLNVPRKTLATKVHALGLLKRS